MKKKRKNQPKKSNKGKTWNWSNNPHGVIKTGDRWTLLATECYIRKECYGCIYWRYCKQNSYEDYPIMRQVVRELYRKFGMPPKTCLTPQGNIIIIVINSGRQGYGWVKPCYPKRACPMSRLI